MRRVYLLILVLAATATSMLLAGWATHPADGAALAPAPAPQSAAPQQDCTADNDVGVTAPWVGELDYSLKTPPDYSGDDQIFIYYDVTNYSCEEVTVTLALTGSVSGATIHVASSGTGENCTEGCDIGAGEPHYGSVEWDLGRHPNTTNEEVVATVTVTAPDSFVDTNPDNDTATSTQAINIVNEEPDPAPDISVESITPSVTTAVIGDTIDFTVAISNDGDAEADTTVTLDLGEDTDALDSDTVSNLAADNETTVTLSWDTTGETAGNHSVRALAETDGDGNADNDSATVTVTLEAPAPDVAVKSVTVSKSQAVVGDTVDFTVTLENDGNVPAVTPAVALFDADGADDAAPLASATANTIAVADETTVTISWDTDGVAAGEYSLRVDATIAGDVDATNDSGTATLTLLNPVDVAVSFTSPVAATAVLGNSVSVPFTVTNAGNHDTGAVTVSLYVTQSGAERGQPTATTTESALAVGKSASDTLAWDTAAATVADYDLEVVAETAGDTVAANDSVVAYVELRNWLKLKNVAPQSSVAVVGNAVTFTAQVENVGTGEVAGVTVGLYESQVTDPLGSAAIASIAAGDTADASIQWDTDGRDVGQVELFVSVVGAGQDPDRDDYQSVNVTINNPIALSSAAPAAADNIAGTVVSINVGVGNASVAAADGVTVALYVGDAKTPNVSADLAAIPPGRRGAAVLEWDTADVSPGRHRLKIVASMAGYDSDGDDESLLVIALRAPVVNVALTGTSMSRSVAAIGQTLEVVATVANRGEAPAAIPVKLYLGGPEQKTPAAATTSPRIQPGSSAEVTLQWESTGESVGTHTLKVVADLTGDTTADDNEARLEIELFRSAYDGIGAPGRCVEDVAVKVNGIRDLSGGIRTTSEYRVGENLRAAYEVYNFSCGTDITLILKMTGPGGHGIKDAAARCFSKCVVPFGGKAEGEIAWMIPTLPAVSDGTVNAEIVAWRPGNFENVNRDNDTAASTDKISIVHPADVVLYLGSRDSGKGKVSRTLAPPVFGKVDFRLASARPPRAVLPFADDTIAVTVAVANHGDAPEPAVVSFLWNRRTLSSHRVVIPAGQAKREILQVPVSKLPHSENHTIAVTLSSAMDPLPSRNNTAFIGIRREAPLVDVKIEDMAVSPDVLMLGDNATVSLTVRNESEIALPLSLELYVDDDAEPIAAQTVVELAPDGQSEELINWRVPASARMLGKHRLRLAASSEEFGAVDNTDKDVTFHIDAEILRINASPTDTAMRGEEVAIEVEVQNNGPATVNVPVTLRFPSATKNPETRSPTVRSGETGSANFVWRTRDYAVGDHTLTATVPDQHNASNGDKSAELAFQITPLAVSATILGIEVAPEAPRVGEPVTITVTVRNDGPVATRIPVTLRFPSEDKQPESRRPRVEPGATGTASFTWNTGRYPPGSHPFVVEVASDPPAQSPFTIELLPPLVNAAIVGMGTDPAGTAMVGEPVEVWIEVRNDGPAAMNVPVRLTFPSAGKRPETRSPRVGPGETARVSFEWKTSDYDAGIHTLGAAVLLDNNVTVGQTTAELRFTLTPLVVSATILGIEVAPEAPRVGEPVTITVTVRNDGPVAMRIPVTLRFPSDGRQPETRRPRVEPGATGTASFTWNTGRYPPGSHPFVVEVASDPPAQSPFTIELLPPLVNAAIVGMGTDPADTAMVGEPVEVWIEVRNDGPAAMNVPVRLTFPSAGKRPETRSPRVGPGETAKVTFEWKTSDYDAGIHTLGAAVLLDNNVTVGQTTEELRFTLTPLAVSATILGIEATPETPRVGEPVTITVSVRNDGPVAANIPVTLRFPSEDKQPETRRPRIEPGATGTASFTWSTGRYPPGSYPFAVEAASDPPAQSPFTIELLPPLVNAAIVGMGTDPADTAMVGELVEVWIEVRNDGPAAMNVPVRLTFPAVGKRPENRSPRVGPGETARVSFQWKTSDYDAGIHTLGAAVLLDNNVTVGQTTEELRFTLTPLVVSATILEIEVAPEAPRVGEPVTITVAVRNDGPVATRIPVTLRFSSEDKQPETRSPWVKPGESAVATFTWLTGRYEPGGHGFVVEVASTPPSKREFTVKLIPPIVDVAIVGIGSDPAGTAVRGQAVTIWVDVINNGPSALSVPVQLSFPSREKQPERKSPRIEPGEIARVEFTWKTANYDRGVHSLTAALLAEHNITVLDTSATIDIRLISPQLIASIVDVSWSPDSPVVGDPVAITITVRNDGLAATNIPITLHFPSNVKHPETRRPRVAPGSAGSASFEWRTTRYEPGGHVFRAQIPGVAGAIREFEIELRPPEVDFAVVEIYPPDPLRPIVKGDWVQITAVVRNLGPYAGRGVVALLNEADADTMYEKSASLEPGESRDVEFTWKTLRYPVGGYDLLVRVDAEYDTEPNNDVSDPMQVWLLTDRDITVGFGNNVRPGVFAEPTSEAVLRAAPWYPNDIQIAGVDRFMIDPPMSPASESSIGVAPKPMAGKYDPSRMYWQWRSAQISPWECARFQQTVGESLPRAVVCPHAPALVR